MTWQGVTFRATKGRCDFEVIGGGQSFLRGDANDDGLIDISDALFSLGCKFLGEECPRCRDAADFNDDGLHDISDAISTLSFLFLGGSPSPAPGPDRCGQDPTADPLPPCRAEACRI